MNAVDKVFKLIRERTKKEGTVWKLGGKDTSTAIRTMVLKDLGPPHGVRNITTCPLIFAAGEHGTSSTSVILRVVPDLSLEELHSLIDAADFHVHGREPGPNTTKAYNLRRRMLRATGLMKGK